MYQNIETLPLDFPISEKETQQENYTRQSFSRRVRQHFDDIADKYPIWRRKMRYFISHTTDFLKAYIPENQRVLLIGCISHEILDSLNPSQAVGIDISEKMVAQLKKANTNAKISYQCTLPENFETKEKFDYVVLLNVADYTQDFFVLAQSLQKFVHQDTKIISSMLNPIWYKLTRYASLLKIRIPDTKRNLIANQVFSTALRIKGFRVDDVFKRILIPKHIPLLSWFVNQFIARIPPFNWFCYIHYVSARPVAESTSKALSCSVIVPCYNEEGNIAECVRRIPKMGSRTEIVVVDDGSIDKTAEISKRLSNHDSRVKLVSYRPNRGKGAAVLEGIRQATGDVVMICDADMTVPPEELTEFHEAIDRNAADFVSGTRFLYPMDKEAMRLANYFGNMIFSKLVQIIAGTGCSDSLCGTKAMRRQDFKNLKIEDSSWGDFDIIFHAAKRKLKAVQVPVHYKNRVHGESKMKAFRSGITFLKLCFKKWAEMP